jgi:hypothetical protein
MKCNLVDAKATEIKTYSISNIQIHHGMLNQQKEAATFREFHMHQVQGTITSGIALIIDRAKLSIYTYRAPGSHPLQAELQCSVLLTHMPIPSANVPNSLCIMQFKQCKESQAALLAVVLIRVIFFAFFFFPCPEPAGLKVSLPRDVAATWPMSSFSARISCSQD